MSELVYQGITIREDVERLNMTDAWKAQGSPKNLAPYDWLRTDRASALVSFLAESENTVPARVLEARPGRGGGTWAHWKIVLAYAADLSPAFKSWCLDVVRAHMLGKLGTGQSTADVIVTNHVANPSHFRSFVKIRDNRAFAHAMKCRLVAMAHACRCSFNRAHGAFRRNFKCVSYLETTLDMYELGMSWILLHIDNPGPFMLPAAPENYQQLKLAGFA